ncbi:hypothetical protein IHE61_12850 [Streptomyces sp. GKU 257-1]|nr:hypothetical protein [Streptomyces sp. GKU 257-1]
MIGAVVGALLAAGGLAWQAGELPFVSRERCWGALSADTVGRLFSDGDIRTRELSLRSAGRLGEYSTECRLQRWKDDELKWEISARVEQLAQFDGRGAREWTREFLSPAMVPLGGDLPGMVSAGRAWMTLPESCVGRTAGRAADRRLALLRPARLLRQRGPGRAAPLSGRAGRRGGRVGQRRAGGEEVPGQLSGAG